MSNYLRRKEVLLNIVNLKSIELIPNLTVEIVHTIFFIKHSIFSIFVCRVSIFYVGFIFSIYSSNPFVRVGFL